MCPSTTPGASRSYATASRSGTAPSSPSMLRLSAPFFGTANRTPAQRPSMTGKLTPSLTAAEGAAWSCLGLRLAAAGTPKPPPSSPARALARARASATPDALRPAAQAAWVLRWSGLVAVAVQRALATTFLEPPLHAAWCCRTNPGLARAPRRRPLDQRPSAEPRRGSRT